MLNLLRISAYVVLIIFTAEIVKAQNFCFITVSPTLAPVGFGVSDTGLNGSGYYPFDLATSSSANWGIVAYSNPANESYLSAFTSSTSGATTTYSTTSSGTAAQGMAVSASFNSSTGINTQTLSQTGVGSSGCSTGEFDLFLDANSHTLPTGDPTYPSAVKSGVTFPTLDKLIKITLSGTVALVSQSSTTTPGPCVVNQSAMLYSLVFTNSVSSQTFYYQLEFNFFCYHGTDSSYNSFCDAEIPSMNYFFTGSGGVWGIDDPINNYINANTTSTYSLLQSNGSIDLEINFLPRISNLIQSGQYGLDTNLSHWTYGSFYYGQHTWGSASLSSTWTSANLSPTIVYAH